MIAPQLRQTATLTDDLIRFWRSKVKISSRLLRWRRRQRRRWAIKVHLIV